MRRILRSMNILNQKEKEPSELDDREGEFLIKSRFVRGFRNAAHIGDSGNPKGQFQKLQESSLDH